MEVLLCERVNDLRHSLFHLLNCCYKLTLNRAVNQNMHRCRKVEEQRKQVGVRKLYNQVSRRFESVGASDRGLWALSDPRLSNSSQDAKEVLLWSRKNLGQYSSPSLSPLISHTTNITLSKIKCERVIYL